MAPRRLESQGEGASISDKSNNGHQGKGQAECGVGQKETRVSEQDLKGNRHIKHLVPEILGSVSGQGIGSLGQCRA